MEIKEERNDYEPLKSNGLIEEVKREDEHLP